MSNFDARNRTIYKDKQYSCEFPLMKIKKFAIALVLFSVAGPLNAYKPVRISPRNAENVVSEESLLRDVEFLADSVCAGRRTGTPGATIAAMWLAMNFENAGLMKMDGSYFQGFPTRAGETGHNVIGFFPSEETFAKKSYIIIGAHYDNLGILHGTLYPGADSNASGVASMLALARMLVHMKKIGKSYHKNVIFVAFDGKFSNMRGAEDLFDRLQSGALKNPMTGEKISKKEIDMMVNLDQVGSSLAPLSPGREDYLIMLSGDNSSRKSTLSAVNSIYGIGLDLGFSYYGSADFTKLFYRRVSEQKFFISGGIESVMFTSGITLNNNKPYDNAGSINYKILRERTLLIYYWLTRFL